MFVDFHNSDVAGRVRLNTVGAQQNTRELDIELREGLELLLYSDEFEADGCVTFSEEEKIWVANINWDQIRAIRK